jgi:hypothetical protein
MNPPKTRTLLALTALLALAACTPDKPKTAVGPTYQAPVASIAPPANVQAICFDEAALSAYRVRMVQQELSVGVLACQGPDGSRQFEPQYRDFITKFSPELSTNATELKSVVTRKGRNFDVVITEIANRTAQQPTGDPAFCSRHKRALDWSLAPTVSSLTQVPSPYDFGPEMNVFPCPR